MTHTHVRSLVNLESSVRDYGPLQVIQYFEDQFFLFAPIDPEAHATRWIIGERVVGRCVEMFSKYWIESQFQSRNHLNV